MIAYASRTGNLRNLQALRKADWRLIVSRTNRWRTHGFKYALDNGAWSDYQAKRPFQGNSFKKLLDKLGANADFVIAPDIVAGGLASLELSLQWIEPILAISPKVLIAVQDGMDAPHLAPYVNDRVGIFMGGSTEWKIKQMRKWGLFCIQHKCYYHVGRVNTVKRMTMAKVSGADSFDGSSASRYAETLPLLEQARRQLSLLAPK